MGYYNFTEIEILYLLFAMLVSHIYLNLTVARLMYLLILT